MKLVDNGIVLTKRDLLHRCNQMEQALCKQATRTDLAEKECARLRTELIRTMAALEEAQRP